MSDVSVISIISNETVYKEWLQKSLDTQQGVVTEFIPVFNVDNAEFDSARAALNYGASQAKGKYLLFAHQDIRFLEDDVIKKIYDYAESIDDFGVMGIAGAPGGGRDWIILTNIIQGEKGTHVGEPIEKPTEVMTVDECLFVVRRDTWLNKHFSPREGWHLYAVEYCLKMIDAGRKNYVVPSAVWHKSDGVSLDYLYCDQIHELLMEYKDKYKYLNTTVKSWPTSFYGREVYLRYYRVKQIIKHLVIE